MNIPKTVKVGDVVRVEAIDLTKRSGTLTTEEKHNPQMEVDIYGKVLIIQPEYIGLVFCEDVSGDEDSNFDERLYIPRGCIRDITIFKRGKNGKARS